MRVVYFTLAILIVLNIGAACRTPPPVPAGCQGISGGLVHCADPETGDGG